MKACWKENRAQVIIKRLPMAIEIVAYQVLQNFIWHSQALIAQDRFGACKVSRPVPILVAEFKVFDIFVVVGPEKVE